MTQYRHPDYDIALVVELSEFRQVSGTSLDVSVAFGQQTQHVLGMLILPEGNEFPEVSETCKAWLWLDECTDMDPGTEVDVQIIRPCGPMLTSQEHKQLLPRLGTHLRGNITRNWNAEQPHSSNV